MSDATQEAPRQPSLATASQEIAARIEQLRRRQGRVFCGTGIAMAVTVLGVWLASETVTDFLANLPWLVRLAFFVVGVGGAGLLCWWFGIRRWRQRLDDDAVALMIERALPEFRSRFIAAVQLAKAVDAQTSPALVKALVAETTAIAGRQSFDGVIQMDRLRTWRRWAFVVVIVTTGLAFVGGPKTLPLLTRALLLNNAVPRKTLIRDVTGDRVVAIGDDVRIEATGGGIVPAQGSLRVKTQSGKQQEFEMSAEVARPQIFARGLQSVQESFDYVVALGDAESASFHVKVKPRPAVASIECQQIFPAYTKLPAQRRPLGDLKILAGSKLALRVKASAAVKTGEIRLVGAEREQPVKPAPLVPDPKDAMRLAGAIEIPAKGVGGMTLHLVDEDGVESRGGAVYPIEVILDQPPTIRILWPDRREELLTREATLLVSFEAKDDYGIAKVRLHYAVDWVEGAPHKSIDLDLGGGSPRELMRRFDWRIGQIVPHVEPGSVIDYWLEATDANNITGPGIGTIDHYQARIVSEAEKRADLANRLSDTMEGLNGVRLGQEEVNRRLGEIIFEKPPDAK